MSLSTLSGQEVSVSDRILSRQVSSQTILSFKSWKAIINFQIIKNISVEKERLSTIPGFEPESFDCRLTAQSTELHRRPTSLSPQEDLVILRFGILILQF